MKTKKYSRHNFFRTTRRQQIKSYKLKKHRPFSPQGIAEINVKNNTPQKKIIQLSSFILKSEVIGSLIQSIVLIFGALLIPFIFTIVQDHNLQIKDDIAHKEKILEQFISNFSPSIGYYYKYASRTLWIAAQNVKKNGLYLDGSSFEETKHQKQFYFDKYNAYMPYDFTLNQICIEFNDKNITDASNALLDETNKLFQVDFSNVKSNDTKEQIFNQKLALLDLYYKNVMGRYNILTRKIISKIFTLKTNKEEDRLQSDAKSLAKYLRSFF